MVLLAIPFHAMVRQFQFARATRRPPTSAARAVTPSLTKIASPTAIAMVRER